MNKWSLLLFSVLGLLLSTTSELKFVDGRLGCCDRSSRPLLSDTRLFIYESHCAYNTFTEKKQLISPQRDIPHASRNVELKLSSRSDGHSEGRRISSDERFRVLSNVEFDLEDSTLSIARDRKALRENNDLKLRRNLKSFSRDSFRKNHVDRSRSRNNVFPGNKMERNSRERRINIEEELSEISDNRFRRNDGPVSFNLKDRKQERFNRGTFVKRTNIMPHPRENIDEIRLRFIQKNEGKRDMERSNLDINSRQRLFGDTRLTSDLSRNSDRRIKKDDRSMELASNIGILRNRNIRDYRRLSARDDIIEKMYGRERLTDVRRNTDMDGTVNVYRTNYNEDISEEVLERINSKNMVIRVQNERFTRLDKSSYRTRSIQRKNEGSGNRIREDKRQMNNGYEMKLFEERYSIQRLPSQNSNINRLQEIRQARFYNDITIEEGRRDYSNVFIETSEGASDQSRNRKIRENNREKRISEEYMAKRITPRDINSLVEKRSVSSNINKRRTEAFRRSVLEHRERETSRYRLDHENENNFDQRRIRHNRNGHNEDKLVEARNTQRKLIRINTMGLEINNIRQIYDDDNVSQGFLARGDNNKNLVSRLERENLSRTGKRAPQITIIQRDNQNKMHIRAMNLQENRIHEDLNFNRRLVSNTNRNIEKRRSRAFNEKSDREEFRNSLVRDDERAFDESRIRQVRDNHQYRREYRSNVDRTVERVLTNIDRNRNNVLESGFESIISSIGRNRIYGISRSAVTVLRRRVNYEVRYVSTHENERKLDQRRTRDVLERREDDLSNERLVQRNIAPKDSMNNAMLNSNRRSYNHGNNPQVILIRTNLREMIKRSERDSFSAVIKRSSHLRMIQRKYDNRMRNEYRLPMNIQENRLRRERCANRCLAGQDSDNNRIVEDRRAGTPKEKLNTRNILALETKRSVDENQISQLRDIREYKLIEKLNAERVLVRNINNIVEKRESSIRNEFGVNHQNQKTKRTLILLQHREKDVPSLRRLYEQNGSGIVRNRRELTRIEEHGRTIPIAEIRGLKNINERSNIRDDETHNERRAKRVIRNIARHGVSINNRDLLEARSDKQRNVDRELDYIRYVRNYKGLEHSSHREYKENVRTSERNNNRGRDAQDRARDIRASNGLQISNKEPKITKTRITNEVEREMRTTFSKIRYLPIEHEAQENQIFEIKLQYIFYILQGLYVLGLFTKFTINSDRIQKRTRFSYWFPLLSISKVHCK